MYAEKALQQSKSNLIETDVRNGLMIIFRSSNTSENYHLYFMPRDTGKNCSSAEMVEIGLYDDLDIAVTIAGIGYGAYESKWTPIDQTRSNMLNNIQKIISDPV